MTLREQLVAALEAAQEQGYPVVADILQNALDALDYGAPPTVSIGSHNITETETE